ncbi:MAG TPA: twin-arginine translocase subunit TatC, partial [Thermoanaerobaculia bacterium]
MTTTAQAGVDSPPGDEETDRGLTKMSFLEHLEELRKRLVWSFIYLGVGFALCWHYADIIFAWIQKPLTDFLPNGDKLAYTKLTGPFFLYMKVAF